MISGLCFSSFFIATCFLVVLSSHGVHSRLCVLNGTCGHIQTDLAGDVPVPCAANHEPRPVDTSSLSHETLEAFKSLCPDVDLKDAVCCNFEQVENLVENLNYIPKGLLERCPSCFHNFASLVSID